MFPAKRICSAVCSLYSPVCLILQPRLGARQTSCLLSRLLFFSLHFGPPLFAWIWPIDAGSLNQHLLEAAVMTSSIIWPRLFLSYGLISFHKQTLCRDPETRRHQSGQEHKQRTFSWRCSFNHLDQRSIRRSSLTSCLQLSSSPPCDAAAVRAKSNSPTAGETTA